MKKTIIFSLFAIFSLSIFAQKADEEVQLSNRFGKADRIMVDVYNDFWLGTPDSANFSKFNRGASVSLMKDFPFGETNFSFAVGLGIGMHNAYNDCNMYRDSNTVTYFVPIKNEYKMNKIGLSFVDLPMEFRFKTKRDNVFRIAVGGKIGYMMNNHVKYSDATMKVKTFKIENINPLRYGVTARVGYKMFNLYAYYGLSTLFKDKKGPEMTPVSVGLSFIPF